MAKTERAPGNEAFMEMDTTISTEAATESVDELFDAFMRNLESEEKAQMASDARVTQAKEILMRTWYNDALKLINESAATEEEKASRVAELQETLKVKTAELSLKLEDNFYKFGDKATKRQAAMDQKSTISRHKETMRNKAIEIASDNSQRLHKISDQKKYIQGALTAGKEEIKCEQKRRALTREIIKERRKDGLTTVQNLAEQHAIIAETYEAERQGHEENIALINEQMAALEAEKEQAASEGLPTGEIDALLAELQQQKDEEKSQAKEADKARFKEELANNAQLAAAKSLSNAANLFADAAGAAVEKAMEMVGQYQGVIDARLQGTQSTYDDVAHTLKKNLAMSPFVRQTEVLAKLSDAVDKGIAYNVEQRAFLATMTDKIVKTFDAFDANLMRLIRLQQADTTSARMGMEATLLQFFNSTYSDNSYLEDGYDDVSKALIDANAGMSKEMSIAFEFNVQKWMGSLASVGFSTETISTIAQGINHLGSGNVAALASNTELQNLLAMSAARAGLSYSELLVKGIDDSSVNKLLKSMVEYLKEIATDKNAVVKAAYGDVFNFSQSDLRAVANLTSSDLSNIYSQSMTYSKGINEVQNQLNQMSSRISMAQQMDTVFDNMMYSAAESLANNPVTALTYKLLSTIEQVTGGIEIPFINIYGFGLDLNMSMENLIQTGMFGLSMLSQVGNMVTSLASGGGMNLGMWGFEETTSRGGNFQSSVGGVQSSTSGSAAVTSAASSDTKKDAIASTEEDQEEQKKSSKEMSKDEITVETLYNEIFENKNVVYTIDKPVYTTLNAVYMSNLVVAAKVDEVTASTKAIETKALEIYNLLTSLKIDGLKVSLSDASITSLGTAVGGSVTSHETVKLHSDTQNDLATTLSKKIKDALLGTGNGDNHGIGGETHTISDLVNLLAYGTIKVESPEIVDGLNEINHNLI